MSSKMNQIPFLSSYEDVRAEMNRDLQYRLNSRTAQTLSDARFIIASMFR